MKVYPGKDIRNVGMVGHGDSGKTSLVAAFLHAGGLTNRLGRVDDGTTTTDYDSEEIERKITISTALAFLEWNKTKINLLDTPGYNIFINDALASLVAADSSLVVVDGVAGVEVQTEKVWDYSNRFNLPRALVVNKLDRERSSFERAVESIQQSFGRAAIPIQWPLGEEKGFHGVADLLTQKAYSYANGGNGKGQAADIPQETSAAVEAAREQLIELIAEGNDAYMEEFFDKGTLDPDHIVQGLKEAIAAGKLFPILCASASNLVGIDLLLNFLTEFAPSPVDRNSVQGTLPGGEAAERKSPMRSRPPFLFSRRWRMHLQDESPAIKSNRASCRTMPAWSISIKEALNGWRTSLYCRAERLPLCRNCMPATSGPSLK